jgi:hypothetical protein
MLERKHYHTQLLFHHQPKAIGRGTDGRHAADLHNKAFVYYKEGDPNPHFECKGLRHDIEVWAERGHVHDVRLFFIFYISILIWSCKQRSLIASKDLLGAGSARRQHVTEALMYADDDL